MRTGVEKTRRGSANPRLRFDVHHVWQVFRQRPTVESEKEGKQYTRSHGGADHTGYVWPHGVHKKVVGFIK